MSLIKKNKEAVALAGIVLKNTKQINQADIESDHAWATVAKEYDENQGGTWFEKAQVVLINMIVYHRKGAFVLTRETFAEACRNDKNWKRKIGLKDENWPKFLYQASGIIEVVKKVKNPKSGRLIYIYKVVMPELLSLLNVQIEEQISNAENFILNNNLLEGTLEGTKVGNTEEEVEKDRDTEMDTEQDEKLENLSGTVHCTSSVFSALPNPNPPLAPAEQTVSDQSKETKLSTLATPKATGSVTGEAQSFKDFIKTQSLDRRISYCLMSEYLPQKYEDKFLDFQLLVQNGNSLSEKQVSMVNDWCARIARRRSEKNSDS